MKFGNLDIKYEFKFKNITETPAIMTMHIGPIEIRGFPIRKTKFNENIQRFVLFPPSIKIGTGWSKIFFIKDKEIWETLQEDALKQFEDEYDKYLFNNIHESDTY